MLDRLRGERNVSRALLAFRRLWWIIGVVALVSAGGAYLLGKRQPVQYSASASLLLRTPQLDQSLTGIQVSSPSTDPARDPATDQSLLTLATVATRVAHHLHMSTSRVQSEISVGSDALSDVVPVTATDTSPTIAAELANAYVNQYIAFRRQADRSQLSEAEQLINNQIQAIPPSQQAGPAARALQARRDELQLLASLQTGNAEVVQAATPPKSPSGPHPKRDALIGLLLGLLVGAALVIIIERRDGRFRSPREIADAYEVPIIGTVPESSALRQGTAIGTPRDQDAFRMIRSQLRYCDVDRVTKSVLITSADRGEGKSVVAAGLARAAGQTRDKRALLMESDMRWPSLPAVLGLERVAGLAELLSDSQELMAGLRELVVTIEQANGSGPASRFDVLLAGATPPNPGELLDSKRMAHLMDVLESMYDMIVIDSPPVGVNSDAVPLVHRADGVLVVSRLGKSRRDHAIRLMKRLRSLNAHLLGVVINCAQPSLSDFSNYDRRVRYRHPRIVVRGGRVEDIASRSGEEPSAGSTAGSTRLE